MAAVYLHIGTPKTGTTALQNFLSDNNETLNKYGICYPDFGYRYHNVGIPRNAHFLISPYIDENGTKTHEMPGNDYEPGLNRLAELADTFDKIIISDEVIWRASSNRADFWPKLKSDLEKRNLDIKIIVYLRRQDLWASSSWGQKIKSGSVFDFHGYLQSLEERNYPTDYFEYMEKLSAVFGQENLFIRVYEQGQFQGTDHSLISDFLNIFGLAPNGEFVIKKEFYNRSSKGNYLEIQRLLNNMPDFYATDTILKKSIRDTRKLYPDENQSNTFTWQNSDEQRAYLESFAESNKRLAEKYLHRADGILFYETIGDFPDRRTDEQELDRDMLLVCGRAIHLLELENQTLKKELSSLQASTEQLRKYSLLLRLKNFIRRIII